MMENNSVEFKRKRSLGVTIFGWYFIVSGVSYFIILPILIFSKIPTEKLLFIFHETDTGPYGSLFSIGMIFLGNGLLDLQEVARKLTIWFCGFGIFLAIIGFLIDAKKFNPANNIASLIVIVSAFYFFTRQKVKEQFK